MNKSHIRSCLAAAVALGTVAGAAALTTPAGAAESVARASVNPAGEQGGQPELERQVPARGQHRPGSIALGQADILEDDAGKREQHDLRPSSGRERHAPALLQASAHEAGRGGGFDRPRQAGGHEPQGEKPESGGGEGAAQRHCTP